MKAIWGIVRLDAVSVRWVFPSFWREWSNIYSGHWRTRFLSVMESVDSLPGSVSAYVAMSDESPVGGLLIERGFGWPTLASWLSMVWIMPSFRGRGVASFLLESVLSRECRESDVMLCASQQAIYARHGFERLAHDSFMMRCSGMPAHRRIQLGRLGLLPFDVGSLANVMLIQPPLENIGARGRELWRDPEEVVALQCETREGLGAVVLDVDGWQWVTGNGLDVVVAGSSACVSSFSADGASWPERPPR